MALADRKSHKRLSSRMMLYRLHSQDVDRLMKKRSQTPDFLKLSLNLNINLRYR